MQPVDSGLGNEIKRRIGKISSAWLANESNLLRWEGGRVSTPPQPDDVAPLTASDRRCLMAQWAAESWFDICALAAGPKRSTMLLRYFQRTGCHITSDLEDDMLISPEQLTEDQVKEYRSGLQKPWDPEADTSKLDTDAYLQLCQKKDLEAMCKQLKCVPLKRKSIILKDSRYTTTADKRPMWENGKWAGYHKTHEFQKADYVKALRGQYNADVAKWAEQKQSERMQKDLRGEGVANDKTIQCEADDGYVYFQKAHTQSVANCNPATAAKRKPATAAKRKPAVRKSKPAVEIDPAEEPTAASDSDSAASDGDQTISHDQDQPAQGQGKSTGKKMQKTLKRKKEIEGTEIDLEDSTEWARLPKASDSHSDVVPAGFEVQEHYSEVGVGDRIIVCGVGDDNDAGWSCGLVEGRVGRLTRSGNNAQMCELDATQVANVSVVWPAEIVGRKTLRSSLDIGEHNHICSTNPKWARLVVTE